MINLLIIDDHPLVADGISTMLKNVSYLNIIGSCKSGVEALTFLRHQPVQVILLDINLPDIDGVALCEQIITLDSEVLIVMLTSINEINIVTQALAKGAKGYLLKDMEKSELLTAIDNILNGKMYLSPVLNEKLLANYNNLKDLKSKGIVLTRREKEVLHLLSQGLNGPQIASTLFLSPHTVESHRKNLMQKLNANSVQSLLKEARALRFI